MNHHLLEDPDAKERLKIRKLNPMFTKISFPLLLSSFLLSSLFFICRAIEIEVEDETPFGYEEGSDNGPQRWAKIDPHWKTCGNGEMQSPIDLLNKRVQVLPGLGKLKRDYRSAPAKVKNRGHDIAVEWEGDAGVININETYYSLKQCHWHSPSEHTFNGSRYNLELHLVHYSKSGQIAVIGITYKYGRPDHFLSKLVPQLGSHGMTKKDGGIINPGDIKFGSRKYYRYMGSLTVPPCTEGVIWTISKKVRTVSREQVRALRDAVHDGYEENARPIQHQNDRTVLLYTPRVTGGFT
ncbi:alpha carbonic anhydrase 4-like [Macadamia integrifolia]|uniref:alpha carbonic anhydrase 4-like n=1 Tax=Macadamia integrifolia TaxID=60698 RepID=UPI001C529EF6|nr:alpha carbonic anhydrase 4-like [Macadamia integrifolia]